MKVALINPKGTLFSRNERLAAFLEQSATMGSFRHFWSAPCLGLLTVAAYCPQEWELRYIDEIQKPVEFSADYDLVFLSAMTVQAKRAYEIADAFRARGVRVVMGESTPPCCRWKRSGTPTRCSPARGRFSFRCCSRTSPTAACAPFTGRSSRAASTSRAAAPRATT